MNPSTRILSIPGPAGAISCALDVPAAPRLLALVAHPHPLHGGTMNNKVAQTIARALLQIGAVCWRPNFRGVGESAGTFDHGLGETDDLEAVLRFALAHDSAAALPRPVPLVLAGFSFGTFVQSRLLQRLDAYPVSRQPMVLVGPAVKRFDVQAVPADTLVVHGEEDEVVALQDVFDWARPQNLPLVVMPGASHFFHGRLPDLKTLILRHMAGTHV
ncbi:MAG: alpha/beta hydrolase [Lautropia sp.]|nr:alpha/beta hydrolase [Lautropia sp.]